MIPVSYKYIWNYSERAAKLRITDDEDCAALDVNSVQFKNSVNMLRDFLRIPPHHDYLQASAPRDIGYLSKGSKTDLSRLSYFSKNCNSGAKSEPILIDCRQWVKRAAGGARYI